MSARPVLGRGLNALLPSARKPATPDPTEGSGADAETASGTSPAAASTMLPVALIDPNPDQPRTIMNAVALEELAASIREHGVLQPILVTRTDAHRYGLIAGERRWRAAQLAGLTEIPVLITELADHDALAVALVENLQRQDLSPLEEAAAYARLIRRTGMSQEKAAQRVGKSRSAVANALRLLQLPPQIRLSLGAGEITEGHARAILGAPSAEEQVRLWERVRRRGLTVRQTEQAAKRLRSMTGAPARARDLPGDVLAQEWLQTALSTKVQVQRGRKGGRIIIQWYDDEQLEQITGMIAAAGHETPPPPPDHLTI